MDGVDVIRADAVDDGDVDEDDLAVLRQRLDGVVTLDLPFSWNTGHRILLLFGRVDEHFLNARNDNGRTGAACGFFQITRQRIDDHTGLHGVDDDDALADDGEQDTGNQADDRQHHTVARRATLRRGDHDEADTSQKYQKPDEGQAPDDCTNTSHYERSFA